MNVWTRGSDELFTIPREVVFPPFFSWNVFSEEEANYSYLEGEVVTIETKLSSEEVNAWLPFATALSAALQELEYPTSTYTVSEVEPIVAPFLPSNGAWLTLCRGSNYEEYRDIGVEVRKLYEVIRPSYIDPLDEDSTKVHYNLFLGSDPVARLHTPSNKKLSALTNEPISVMVGIMHSAWLPEATNSGEEVPWHLLDWSNMPGSEAVSGLRASGLLDVKSPRLVSSLQGRPITLFEALRGSAVVGDDFLDGEVHKYSYNALQDRFMYFSVPNWGELYTILTRYLSQVDVDYQKLGLHPLIELPPLEKEGVLSVWSCVAFTTIQTLTSSLNQNTIDPRRVEPLVTRMGARVGSEVLVYLSDALIHFMSEQGVEAEERRPELFCNTALALIEQDKTPTHFVSLI